MEVSEALRSISLRSIWVLFVPMVSIGRLLDVISVVIFELWTGLLPVFMYIC